MRFRRFVIGTAGHVDHGKTTLVRALTGVDTDRLPEEKRRGISIELGFAPWRVAEDVDATIIDVPGHRRLVHTMIAGATGIELVLMVVAADEGVMPQTREHARICEELGIRQAVVALTKSDLVDAETLAIAEEEVRELLAPRFDLTVVPCSATRGEGLDAIRNAVAERLRRLPARPQGGPTRLWIDRVFSVRGAGTVVTGTLVSGSIERGQELVLIGRGEPTQVVARELHVHDRAVAKAEAPTRLAVNLPIASTQTKRGDLLTSDASLRSTTRIDAEFHGARLRRGASLAIHIGTARCAARVTRTEPLGTDEHLVRLVLGEPLPLAGGDRYLLRGLSADAKEGSLTGAGAVLDARPPLRSRRENRRSLLTALRACDARAALAELLDEAAPRPLDLGALPGRFSIAKAIRDVAETEARGGVLVRCGSGVLPRKALGALADMARALVAEHARDFPLDRGLPLATLEQKLAERAGRDAAAAAILAARARRSPTDADAISVEGDVVVPAVRTGRLDPELARAVDVARKEITTAGVHGVSMAKVGEATGAPADRVRALLASLERQGAAVHAGDLWFATEVVEALRARVLEHFQEGADKITVIDFKALGGLPRKQAVLMLELFDRMGLTRRVGEARVLLRAG